MPQLSFQLRGKLFLLFFFCIVFVGCYVSHTLSEAELIQSLDLELNEILRLISEVESELSSEVSE